MDLYKLPSVMQGDLDEFIEALAMKDRSDRLGDGS
jgi:protein subunit release factor A